MTRESVGHECEFGGPRERGPGVLDSRSGPPLVGTALRRGCHVPKKRKFWMVRG